MLTGIVNPVEPESGIDFIKFTLMILLNFGLILLGIVLIYSGYKFVTAQGNEEQINDAKKNILWILIGGALLLGAWGLSIIIGDIVNDF